MNRNQYRKEYVRAVMGLDTEGRAVDHFKKNCRAWDCLEARRSNLTPDFRARVRLYPLPRGLA